VNKATTGLTIKGSLSPERLSALLQRLGPIYLKIGQFLAVRPDLIPQAYCNALLNLTDAADRLSWEQVSAVIRQELGEEPDLVFAHIDRAPLASASLAQVHLARTHGGHQVAVKVQRPELAGRVESNSRSLRRLLRAMEWSGLLTGISAAELADEIVAWLAQELDFTHELHNITRLARMTRDEHGMRIPRVISRLSTSRLLVEEYLPGLPVSEVLRLIRNGRRSALGNLGVDPDQVATNLILSLYTQAFRYHFFHSDPHPGNLLVLPGNVVGFVDFGLCDTLSEARSDNQANFVAAAYAGDVEAIYRELRKTLIAGPGMDEERFRERFLALTNDWLKQRAAGEERKAGEQSNLAQYLIDLMHAIRTQDLRLPGDLLSLYRTLLTAESIASELSRHVDLIRVGRIFFASEQFDRLIQSVTPQRLQTSAFDIMRLGLDGPGQFSQLLGDLAEDRFVLRVLTQDSGGDSRLANLRARLVAVAIVSVGLAVFSGLALVAGRTSIALAAAAAFATTCVALGLIWRSLR
jgi:ubiquinone biosynthesis protein